MRSPAPPVPAADTMAGELVAGNVYDKYRTRNPLFRRLQSGFLVACRDLLGGVAPRRVLEVGCGPGDLVHALAAAIPSFAAARYLGVDVALGEVTEARQRNPDDRFAQASIYELPVAARAADCIVACEVLEHLEQPDAALAEIARVGSGVVLVSVPWEPVWRLLNLARGSYWSRFGNTPGHLQHFSRRAIRDLVASRFEIVGERRPFPWTMLLARVPE